MILALAPLCLSLAAQAAPATASAPVSAMASPTAPSPRPMETWRVSNGAALRDTLYDWGQRAGWTLVWDSEYRYTLDADAVFSGDFPAAVTQLFNTLGELNPPLYPAIYQGNRVLVVKALPSH
ncbi:MAG: toxin co-regulated pilus biosynthesis Q family protein [Paludibacterium sp.]|uniref:toxin co-regulated pilus biosynthesis Q family protein n=1 Tax=Paludibacterium sp. TaxID=1917523 RepID=UPI0025DD8A87|nr:toxin co-regulated pilus biosynthesis Q family protein [Paludibacterium sp.]MBV8046450.1 toxin co-regulated pilus biosynthesis Q family protein [Paludibacterium sp.]